MAAVGGHITEARLTLLARAISIDDAAIGQKLTEFAVAYLTLSTLQAGFAADILATKTRWAVRAVRDALTAVVGAIWSCDARG